MSKSPAGFWRWVPTGDRPTGATWSQLSCRAETAGGQVRPQICGPVAGRMDGVVLTLGLSPALAGETRAEAAGVEGRGEWRTGAAGKWRGSGDVFL